MKVFPLTDSSGQLYSPTRQAATLAKYSRSHESARALIEKTPELNATAFQQKVLVDYGHSSVAELATIPVCFEGVSIIASKMLEAWPRPGCSEKSTRMQKFSLDSMCWPTEELRQEFEPLVRKEFELYEKILAWANKENPTGAKGKLAIQREAFDLARGLLPAGTKTNLALVAYPRDLADIIRTLTGASNPEFVDIGKKLKDSLLEIGGPLIRYTEPCEWSNSFKYLQVCKDPKAKGQAVFLVQCYQHDDIFELVKVTCGMSKEEFISKMDNRPKKADVPDIFKLYRAEFDIFIDYGSFRDIQRHRRMNKFVPNLNCKYGYYTPTQFKGDLLLEYTELLEEVVEKVSRSNISEELKQYVIPMNFIHRSYVDMDLQQLYYLVELRTKEGGHETYRKLAYDMYVLASEVFPNAMQWCRVANPKK